MHLSSMYSNYPYRFEVLVYYDAIEKWITRRNSKQERKPESV